MPNSASHLHLTGHTIAIGADARTIIRRSPERYIDSLDGTPPNG